MLSDRTISVDTMLERDSAKLWLAHDFVSAEECNILRTYAKPRLTRATVAGENGMSTISMNRKAQQAGYTDIRDEVSQSIGRQSAVSLSLSLRACATCARY